MSSLPEDGATLTGSGVHLPESLRRAVAKRRREFIAGRICAVQALRAAGLPAAEQPGIGPRREPLWPAGFCGSIAHSRQQAWAVVASLACCRSIGIDLEDIQGDESARELQSQILTEADHRQWQGTGAALSFGQFFTLVFSAKEALYKCLAPLVGRFFGFQDAEVAQFAPAEGVLTLQLCASLAAEFPAGSRFSVAFAFEPETVRTLLVLPA